VATIWRGESRLLVALGLGLLATAALK